MITGSYLERERERLFHGILSRIRDKDLTIIVPSTSQQKLGLGGGVFSCLSPWTSSSSSSVLGYLL